MSSLHRILYRMTRGVIGRRLVDNDILLLTTRGRGTGREHTVPLLYLRGGDHLVVIASHGGRDRHPEWYLNLVGEPLVTVQIGAERASLRARTATEEEREAWWPRVLAAYSDYAVYQRRTDREIPVVMLEPVSST
jgi:deazaflavin-dependent oxidoreductase (nitroreductase family)